MKLVYEATGQPVRVGDHITLRDGMEVEVTGVEAPRHASSTGRVYVKGRRKGDWARGFFPSVIGARWVEEEVEG